MSNLYLLVITSEIISPALVVFRELAEQNIETMILSPGTRSTPPALQTHKMVGSYRIEFNTASPNTSVPLREAEMLRTRSWEHFLAYNLVGPNIGRAVEFRKRWPTVKLLVCGDHELPPAQLGER